MRDRRDFHTDIVCRMGEPEDLRELRQQAERIEHERKRANDQFFYNLEKDRLRSQIREAGEIPCR